ncbi:zinc-dependent peptidase [Pseudoflavitalea sp. G-6-1-2]|uniref:zinc-dependent peptidase n=1 Tax=Pseudoflavitalea sp. G-6-1-2 TaxID=2728841 RepID=UPI001469AB4B|nr:zinc-dependent peptidase [Pseudoflavitalea sp. G-6-1-2]NML22906.1 zinc-dependent peptidase [Pseudoflavitalea sp. G-6-1-2]
MSLQIPWLNSLIHFFMRGREAAVKAVVPVLQSQFPFFNKLSMEQRKLFAARVYLFSKSKNFHFLGMETNADISTLVSAAAIQLTFGLPEFRFSYFEDIFIIKTAYTVGESNVPWAGHVTPQGIYVAWDHVQRGYATENDGYNVGLHEMAHAMEYELAFGAYAEDPKLGYRFTQLKLWMNENILNRTASDNSFLFSEQGRNNVHECWAESVELFFEKPAELRQAYPDLYERISLLLNQRQLGNVKADVVA